MRLGTARAVAAPLIAVIFEARPRDGGRGEYLDIAVARETELKAIDGFPLVEPCQSLGGEAKLLSLSFFLNEAAVRTWRDLPRHRAARARGRSGCSTTSSCASPRWCPTMDTRTREGAQGQPAGAW